MALWVLFVFVVLSATFILFLSLGPLKAAANTGALRAVAFVQYGAAALLALARLTGVA